MIGVLVFAGLTAYDTQRIKAMYFDGSGNEGKKAIMGALTLYLDFINLFIMLIQLLDSAVKSVLKSGYSYGVATLF